MRFFSLILAACVVSVSCTKKIEQPPTPGTDRTSIQIASNSINSVDTFKINYESDWLITTDPQTVDWLELSALSGSGPTEVYLTVKKINTSSSSRTVTLTVTPSDGELPATVTVTQQPYTFAPWSRLYGGSAWDNFSDVIATEDGGLIATGFTFSTDGDVAENRGNNDIWVVKLDAAGNLEWEKTYGTTAYERSSKIVATGTGYTILGTTGTTTTLFYLLNISEDGDVLWDKTIDLGANSNLSGIAAVPSGGIICSGMKASDALLMRLDENGEEIWSKSYGGDLLDRLFSVDVMDDGSFIAVGNKGFPQTGTLPDFISHDAWVVNVDADGNLLWEKMHGGSNLEWGYYIIATSDGGALVESMTESDDIPGYRGLIDILLTKIDGSGNLQWNRAYGSSFIESANDIAEVTGGHFMFSAQIGNVVDGDITENIGETDAWLVKVDATTGDIIWQDVFGGTAIDVFTSVNLAGNRILLAGQTNSTDGEFSSNHGDIDAWVKAMDIP